MVGRYHMRLNWKQLKQEFMQGRWQSVSEFFRDHAIQNNSRNRVHARGWAKERQRMWERIYERSYHDFTEDKVSLMIRQMRLAQKAQEKGMEELIRRPINSVSEACKLLVEGLRQEREAMGIHEGREQAVL